MPDAYEDEDGRKDKEKKDKLLFGRYEDTKDEVNENELWEKEQIQKSKMKFGASEEGGKKKKKQSDEYDLVVDSQIDFVKLDIMDELEK